MNDILFDQQITFLYTRDLAATARFYEDVLGLPLTVDQGDCRIYRVSADGFHLLDAPPARLNAKDTPIPYHPNLWAAHRPNSISRVFSGCSSRLNFANR